MNQKLQSRRGRPSLTKDEAERRMALYPSWAKDIKAGSGLSSRELEAALRAEMRVGAADGRTWRNWMAGTRSPTLESFASISQLARQRGWLAPGAYLLDELQMLTRQAGDGAKHERELADDHHRRMLAESIDDAIAALTILATEARRAGVGKVAMTQAMQRLISSSVFDQAWEASSSEIEESRRRLMSLCVPGTV